MADFIVEKSVERYLHDLIPRRDPLLAEMEERARREDIKIIGPLAGRLLALLVELAGARRNLRDGFGDWLFDHLDGARRRNKS